MIDKLIFAVANAWTYLRHPRVMRKCRKRAGFFPNVAEPGNLAELIHWRKVFDHNPLFAALTDKLFAKDWVRGAYPSLLIPETLWVGHDPADIPDRFLAPGYVVKTTHGSSQNYFPGRGNWNRSKVIKTFNRWLKDNRSDRGEWAYGQVQPRIFVERMLQSDEPILDIKVRAFDGAVPVSFLQEGAKTSAELSGYFLEDGSRHPRDPDIGTKAGLRADFIVPPLYKEALQIASTLSRGFDYVRVDMLLAGGKLYFSEMTFYSGSGYYKPGGIDDEVVPFWLESLKRSWFVNVRHSFPRSIYANAFKRRFIEPIVRQS